MESAIVARTAKAPLSERMVESIYVGLAAWLLAGAYVAAWDALRPAGAPSQLGAWQDVLVDASWFALTGFLLAVAYVNHVRGQAIGRVLPYGYEIALAACVLFAMGVILEPYWLEAFPVPLRGEEQLFSPPRLLEVAAAGVIVAAPLRSALARRDPVATLPVLLSAALVLSVLTFATQSANPIVDPWEGRAVGEPSVTPWWVAQDLGTVSILFQALLAGFVALVMLRSFQLRAGSLTLLFTVNGILVCLLKTRFEYLPAMVLTGVVADVLLATLRPGRDRPLRLRLFAALVPVLYSGGVLLTAVLHGGTWWTGTLVAGLVVMSGLMGWLASYLALSYEGRTGAAASLPRGRSLVEEEDVKKVLDALHEGDRAALGSSPLTRLPCLVGPPAEAGEELRTILVEVIKELAASRSPRDAEAGQILLEYYVRRIGSHEVVLGPMHMSKQTYFRRLERGKALVRERLDELSEYAVSRAG
jgi:hypothetical protein